MGHFDYDVFLSFASLNESLARPLYERLTGSGLRVFWSDEVLKNKVGDSWYKVIESSLESSKHLLLLWSPEAKASKFVELEYKTFHSETIHEDDRLLIPVLVSEYGPQNLPLFLRQMQGYSLEDNLGELITRLGGRYEPLEIENARLRKELEQAKVHVERLELEQGRVLRATLEELKYKYDNLKKKYTEQENQSAEDRKSQEQKVKELAGEISDLQAALLSEKQTVISLQKERTTFAKERKKEKAPISTTYSLRSGIGGSVLGAVLAGIIFWMIQGGSRVEGELPVTAGAQQTNTDSTSQISDSVQREITRDGIDFVYIPAGEFMMGSDNGDEDEVPVHPVEITKGFYLGKTEVTQAQWERVMGQDSPSEFKGPNRPVERVSWNKVQEFIELLNEQAQCNACYRLPTEAEWEYAARAGGPTAYSFGDDPAELGDYAWYDENSNSSTQSVQQKKPNPWGLYDMHGNVWEWVYDRYGQYENGTVIDDPVGPDTGSYRVVRGGGWYNDARGLRSANRYGGRPDIAYYFVGFRLLRTIP